MEKLELALDFDLGRNSRGYPVRFLDTIVHRCVHWLVGEAGSGSCLCVCVLDSSRSRAVDGVAFALCAVCLPHGLPRNVKCDRRCFMVVLLGKATVCIAHC